MVQCGQNFLRVVSRAAVDEYHNLPLRCTADKKFEATELRKQKKPRVLHANWKPYLYWSALDRSTFPTIIKGKLSGPS